MNSYTLGCVVLAIAVIITLFTMGLSTLRPSHSTHSWPFSDKDPGE
jgi:hypothetical protein